MTGIDAHVHVWTDDYARFPFAGGQGQGTVEPRVFLPGDILAHANPCGVDRVVLVQMSYYTTDNSYMLHVIEEHPGVFSGIGIVDPTAAKPDREMIRLKDRGVRGFRISPGKAPESWLDGDGFERMFRAGGDHNLAMCPLINPAALPALERQCERFSQTPVIIDHLCRIGADGEIREHEVTSLCALARFPNVMVKVSAFYALGAKTEPYHDMLEVIRRVVDAFGPQRLMWASDAPYQVQPPFTYAASVELIAAGLDDLAADDRARILGGTASDFFFR